MRCGTEHSVSGFAGASYNGKTFQIKVLGKSKGTDAVRQRFALALPACLHLAPASLLSCYPSPSSDVFVLARFPAILPCGRVADA